MSPYFTSFRTDPLVAAAHSVIAENKSFSVGDRIGVKHDLSDSSEKATKATVLKVSKNYLWVHVDGDTIDWFGPVTFRGEIIDFGPGRGASDYPSAAEEKQFTQIVKKAGGKIGTDKDNGAFGSLEEAQNGFQTNQNIVLAWRVLHQAQQIFKSSGGGIARLVINEVGEGAKKDLEKIEKLLSDVEDIWEGLYMEASLAYDADNNK